MPLVLIVLRIYFHKNKIYRIICKPNNQATDFRSNVPLYFLSLQK